MFIWYEVLYWKEFTPLSSLFVFPHEQNNVLELYDNSV